MARIESGSDRSNSSWSRLIFPDPLELMLFTIISFFILFFINIKSLWDFISQNLIGGDSSAVTSSLPKLGHLNDIITNYGRLAVAVFWAAMGLVVYTIFWIIYSLIIGARNDIVASHFVRPKNVKEKQYWLSVFNYKGELLLGIILLFLFIIICFKIIPIFSQIYLISILKFSKNNIFDLLISIIGMTLLIHIANFLRMFLIDAWRRQIF